MSGLSAGVESIYAKRITTSGTVEYFVKWKGFPAAQNTWETRGDLTGRGIAHSARVPSSAIRTIAAVRDVVAAPGTPGSSRRGGGSASRSSSSPATRAATGASASAASDAQFERIERMLSIFEIEEAQRRKRAESEEDPDDGGSGSGSVSAGAPAAIAAAPQPVADDRRSPLTIHRPRRLKKSPLPTSSGGARGSSSPPKTPSPLSGGENSALKPASMGESKVLTPADSEGDEDVPLAQYAALLRKRRMPKPEAAEVS